MLKWDYQYFLIKSLIEIAPAFSQLWIAWSFIYTQHLYYTAFILHSIYITQRLYYTAFILHSIYITQHLYYTAFILHSMPLNDIIIIYSEWPHRKGGCLAWCGCTFESRWGSTDVFYARGAQGVLTMRVGVRPVYWIYHLWRHCP